MEWKIGRGLYPKAVCLDAERYTDYSPDTASSKLAQYQPQEERDSAPMDTEPAILEDDPLEKPTDEEA